MSSPPERPDPDLAHAAAYYRSLLERVYRDRDFVVIGGPVVGLAPLAISLRELGAKRCFLLGSAMGTGPTPDPAVAEWYTFDQRSESVNDEFRRYESTLRALPDGARAALDRFDPHKSALAIGTIILSDVPDLDGRARYARRPRAWLELEDKVAVESFWDAAGVDRAPSAILDAAGDATDLANAWRRLDRGDGVVLAADSRDGVHGGAEFTRWARSLDEARDGFASLRTRCDRIRVMPFLEGVPCSIHGLVLPDFVAVFRPVEMIVLRRPTSGAFVYAGVATFWDPPAGDRDALRALARRVGEALRERVGFGGLFTIDGVLGAEGFRPTELNPRIGAGLGPLAASAPELPLAALALAAAHGEPLDYRGEWLESLLVDAADRKRSGRGSLALRLDVAETCTRRVRADASRIRESESESDANGSLVLGPGTIGSFFSYFPDPGSVQPGTRFAPWVARAFELADRLLGTGIGAVVAAPEVPRATRIV